MQVVKYFFVGGAASVVDLSIFTVFAKFLEYNYFVVATCGFILATFVNYLLSVRFVFESGVRYTKKKEVTWIYIISAMGLALNLLILYICIDLFDVEMITSKIIATGIVFFWNYLMRKNFIFKEAAL